MRGIAGLLAAAGGGYMLVVRGALTLDLGVGRRVRPLGPIERASCGLMFVPRTSHRTSPVAEPSGTCTSGGEGIGFVRPVYDYDYWNNPPSGMGWVKEYRFGGGAGEIDFSLPSKDTDTRDPNTLDVIVRPGQTQSQVLD